MAVVYSDNVVEIAVIQTQEGRPVVNVLHLQVQLDLDDQDITPAIEDFRNNWQDHIVPLQTTNVGLLRFEWRSLDTSNNQVGVVEPDPLKPYIGTVAGTVLPPNTSYLVKKVTTNRPRGRRDGRMYLTGVAEDAVDNAGAVVPASAANIQAGLDSFYAGISDSGAFTDLERWPVVLETTPASRAPGPQPVTIGSRRVTSFSLDTYVGTQRDRLR